MYSYTPSTSLRHQHPYNTSTSLRPYNTSTSLCHQHPYTTSTSLHHQRSLTLTNKLKIEDYFIVTSHVTSPYTNLHIYDINLWVHQHHTCTCILYMHYYLRHGTYRHSLTPWRRLVTNWSSTEYLLIAPISSKSTQQLVITPAHLAKICPIPWRDSL